MLRLEIVKREREWREREEYTASERESIFQMKFLSLSSSTVLYAWLSSLTGVLQMVQGEIEYGFEIAKDDGSVEVQGNCNCQGSTGGKGAVTTIQEGVTVRADSTLAYPDGSIYDIRFDSGGEYWEFSFKQLWKAPGSAANKNEAIISATGKISHITVTWPDKDNNCNESCEKHDNGVSWETTINAGGVTKFKVCCEDGKAVAELGIKDGQIDACNEGCWNKNQNCQYAVFEVEFDCTKASTALPTNPPTAQPVPDPTPLPTAPPTGSPTSLPTPPPTAQPTRCPPIPDPTPDPSVPSGGCEDLEDTPDSVCTGGYSIITKVEGTSGDPPEDIFYDIKFTSKDNKPYIKFKVNNPYDESADMYMEVDDSIGAVETTSKCEIEYDMKVCPSANPVEYEVPCHEAQGEAYTRVEIFFEPMQSTISDSPLKKPTDCCCEDDRNPNEGSAIYYVYDLECKCPQEAARREL